MLSSLRQQLFYSFFGLLLLAGFPWLLFLFNSPPDIVALGKIGYFEGGKFQNFPVNHLPERVFNLIRLSYPVAVLLFLLLGIAFFKTEFRQLPAKVLKLLSKTRNFLNREISSLSVTEKIIAGLTFLLIIAERCYYLFQYPIHTDEAASFLLFIQNGPFAIVSFYPIPNNHLLQNLLAWPLTFIFNDPFWAMRIPPVICSFLLSFFGFFLLKRFSGFLAAYLTIALFSFGSLTLFLSTQGRGYMLLTFLAVMAMGLLFKALQTEKPGYWVAFSLTAILGFFAVPVFAWPFGAFLTFAGIYLLVKKHWKTIINLLVAAIVSLTGTFLLYLPLLLVSGWKALFGNKYVASLTPELFKKAFLTFLIEVQGELMGGKHGYGVRVFLVVLGILVLTFLAQKHSVLRRLLPAQTTWFIGLVLVMNLVVYSLLRFQLVLPPPRVLFFKSIFDYLGLAIVLSIFIQLIFPKFKLQLIFTFLGVLIFAGFQVTVAEAFLKDYPQPYYTSPALNQKIREAGAERVYLEEPFYQLFLEYEFARSGRKVKIENQVPQPAPPYDFIVIEHARPFPEAVSDTLYQQIYQDELVKAYRPKAALKK